MIKVLAALALVFSIVSGVMAEDVPRNAVTDLAPTGRLRAAINFGNSVLAQKDPASGEPRGVSPALARELARRLAVPVEFVAFDAAGKVFDALRTGAWDVAFLAIDPARAAGIDFTAPYVVIEGTYIVPSSSPLRAIEDVDRDGVRIAVDGGVPTTSTSREVEACHADPRAERGRGPRSLPQGSARSRGRGEAAARCLRQKPSRHPRDRRALHVDRAGHGHAQGTARRGRGICANSSKR